MWVDANLDKDFNFEWLDFIRGPPSIYSIALISNGLRFYESPIIYQ